MISSLVQGLQNQRRQVMERQVEQLDPVVRAQLVDEMMETSSNIYDESNELDQLDRDLDDARKRVETLEEKTAFIGLRLDRYKTALNERKQQHSNENESDRCKREQYEEMLQTVADTHRSMRGQLEQHHRRIDQMERQRDKLFFQTEENQMFLEVATKATAETSTAISDDHEDGGDAELGDTNAASDMELVAATTAQLETGAPCDQEGEKPEEKPEQLDEETGVVNTTQEQHCKYMNLEESNQDKNQ